jgi:EAL domain-containing protein (putative c-di-GMP-specific phosphodiesterase class I)
LPFTGNALSVFDELCTLSSTARYYHAVPCDYIFQDISYYQCIEVHGRQEMIVAAMKHLTSSDIGKLSNN